MGTNYWEVISIPSVLSVTEADVCIHPLLTMLTKNNFTGEGWVCWVSCCWNPGWGISGSVLRMYLLWVFIISGESARPQVEMGTMPFFVFHLTNCSFLFQGMDYNTFMLSRRILKCTQILFPSLGPHVSVPFRAPSFPFFQFRQTSRSQPRGTVTISLYSLKRRLLDQSLPLHLLVNSLMEYGPFSY